MPLQKATDGQADPWAGLPRRRLGRAALCAGTALQAAALVMLAPVAFAQPAPNARPTGGQVSAGQATIGGNASTTIITQRSQNAAINWTGFDIGSAQTVRFAQPNAKSLTLNRVNSAQPSQIAGHIIANGQIAIVNQSGVVFFHGATIDTAGLVVSAAGITDQDFMAGRLVFSQAPHPGAAISNAGNITISQAGLAALVAPQVANSGVITAQLGRVVLGGATTFALDMNGDGLVALNVTGQVTQVQIGGAKIDALVTNVGTILAPGGTVVLTAAAADGLVQKIIAAGGTIAAPSAGTQTGRVLVSGIGGDVEIDGAVTATGTAAGSKGGQIEVNSDHNVTVAAGASLDASGDAGGGIVAVGTTAAYAATAPYGQASRTAANTMIATGATLAANATHAGNGGRVVVAASQGLSVNGTLTARGGVAAGEAGTIVMEGRDMVINAPPDRGARAGYGPAASLIFVENGDTEIIDGVAHNKCPVANCVPYASFFDEASAGATFDVKGGNLVFTAEKSSTTTLDISFETTALTRINGDITINADTDLAANSITASAAGSIIILGTLSSIVTGGADNLAGQMTLTSGTALVLADGGITEDQQGKGGPTPTGTIIADTLALKTDVGDIQLDQQSNKIGTLISAQSKGTLALVDGQTLTISGNVTATNITLTTSSGDILDSGDMTATAGTGEINIVSAGSIVLGGILTAGTAALGGFINLDAQNGDVVESGSAASLISASLQASASGNVSLAAGAGNIIGFLDSGSAGGDFIFRDGEALVVQGNVTAGTLTGSLATLGLQAASLTLKDDGDVATTLASSGGTIALQADTYVLDGVIDARAAGADGTGEAAFDSFTKNSALIYGGGGDNFGANGLGTLTAGTLVLGSTTDAVGNTGDLEIRRSLPGTAGIGTLGLFSSGVITEAGGVTLVADDLFAGAAGTITLASQSNQIGTIVPFVKTSGLVSFAAIDLADSIPLTIAAGIIAPDVTISAQAGLTEQAGASIDATAAAGRLQITAQSGDLDLFGTLQAGTLGGGAYSGTVLLMTGDGDITETPAGSDTASGAILTNALSASASVRGGGRATGAIDLQGDNRIASIVKGSLSTGAAMLPGLTADGMATLADDQSLDILANVNAANVSVSLAKTGTLNIIGGTITVQDGGTIALSAGAINLDGKIDGASNPATDVVSLAVGDGGITETQSGTLLADTLKVTSDGDADFGSADGNNLVNKIGTLVSGSAAGNFTLASLGTLTVAGTVHADQEMLLDAGSELILQPTATLTAGTLKAGTFTGGAVALQANEFVIAGSTVDVGTGELALDSHGTALSVGVGLGGLGFGSLTAGTLVLGRLPGQLGHATSILIDAPLMGADTIGLVSQGEIIEQAGGSIVAKSLFATADGDITLTSSANRIGTIAGQGLTTTGGTISLLDAIGLNLAGDITATDVSLTTRAGDIDGAGDITANGPHGVMSLDAAGALALSGTLTAGTVAAGIYSGAVDLTAGADVTQQFGGGTGVLRAGTLSAQTGANGTGGDIDLTGANSIAVVTALDAGRTGTIDLADTQSLLLAGAIVNGASVRFSLAGNTLTQSGGTLSATGAGGALIVDAASFVQKNAVASTAHGSFQATGDVSQAGSTLSINGGDALIGGNLSQNAGTLNASNGATIAGSVSQMQGAIAAGLDVTVLGQSVQQSGGSLIDGTGGVYLLIGKGRGFAGGAGGFTQDAASTVSSGQAAPIVINSSAGDIDFAGTLSAGASGLGTLVLVAEQGSIQGIAGGQSGTILAGTLAASALGDLTLDGSANLVASIAPLTITHGAFTAALTGLQAGGALVLRDATSLAIAGSISQAALVHGDSVTLNLLDGANALIGTLSATYATVSAPGDISIQARAFTQNQAALAAAGDVTIAAATAQAGTSSISGDTVQITGDTLSQLDHSTIAAVDAAYLTLTNGFSQDATSLVSAGAGGAGHAVLLIDTAAGDIDLGGIAQAGARAGNGYTGTLALVADSGNIEQTADGNGIVSGQLLAGTLAASAAGSLLLGGAGNVIAAVAPVTIVDQGLRAAGTITLSGLQSGGTLVLADATSLLLDDATVTGAGIALLLPGTLTQSQGTMASTGDILLDALLVAQAGGAITGQGNVIVTHGLNQASAALTATTGTVSIGGDLSQITSTLQAGADLSVTGIVTQQSSTATAGGLATLGALTQVGGTLSAEAVGITGNLAQSGHSSLSSAGSIAIGGSAAQTASSLQAGADLSIVGVLDQRTSVATAAGQADIGALTQIGSSLTAGSIGVGGDATQSAASTLASTAGTIAIAGSLAQANSLLMSAGDLLVGGNATQMSGVITDQGTASIGGTLLQAASTLTATGLYAASLVQGQSSLVSLAGDADIVGAVLQSTSTLTTTGNIVAGTIDQTLSTLHADGDVLSAAVSETQSTLSAVGNATFTGGLGQDASLLSAGGTLSITGQGALTQTNGSAITAQAIFAEVGGGVAQDAASIMDSGQGALELVATGGGMTFDGTLQSATLVGLKADAGSIAGAGTILAGTLAAAAAGDLLLTNTANQIALVAPTELSDGGSLSGLTAGGRLSLADATSLLLAGANLSGTDVTLAIAGALTQQGGSIAAGSGDATLFVAALTQEDGTITAAGGVGITGGALTQSSGSMISGQNDVGITLNGGLLQQGGSTIMAQSGNATLQAASFAQTDSVLHAGSTLTLTGGTLTQAGTSTMFGHDKVAITLVGGINQDAGSEIASFTPDADGAPTNSGTVFIGAGADATFDGMLAASNIQLTTTGQMSWNGNVVLTGGALPLHPILGAPIPFGSQPGVFVQAKNFVQMGETIVQTLPGAAQSTVQIALSSSGGTVMFNPALGLTSGLYAPKSQLILVLQQNGTATGNIDVAGLNVFYTGLFPPTNGAAHLTGEVAGFGGFAAAGAGFTHFVPGVNYEINSCPIQSVNCVLLSPIIVPVNNPVQSVQTTVLRRKDEDDDLILPNVGEQDY